MNIFGLIIAGLLNDKTEYRPYCFFILSFVCLLVTFGAFRLHKDVDYRGVETMKGFGSEIKDVGSGIVKLFWFKIIILFTIFILLNGSIKPKIDEFEAKYNFSVIQFS